MATSNVPKTFETPFSLKADCRVFSSFQIFFRSFNFFQYNTEMELINKYSPFKTEREVLQQFTNIKDQSGKAVA